MLYRPNQPQRPRGAVDNLYEVVLSAFKFEMCKRRMTRDAAVVGALNKLVGQFSKYWKNTGKYPDTDVTATLIEDEINSRNERLDIINKETDNYQKVSAEVAYLRTLLPAKFERKEIDLKELKPAQTNVKWNLHHNRRNVTVSDKIDLQRMH
jgi:hypothetical protein